MNIRNIFGGLLTFLLVLSIFAGYGASTANNITTEENVEKMAVEIIRIQLESEIGDNFIQEIEDGDAECEDYEDIFRALPYECEVVAEQGFQEVVGPQVEEMLEELEEIEEVNQASQSFRYGFLVFSGVLVLLIFLVMKPTSRAFKYLGIIAILIGVSFMFSEVLIEQGVSISSEYALESMVEGEVPEDADLMMENMLDSILGMEVIEDEFERAKNTGIAFIASGFVLIFVYGFKDKLVERLK